MFSCYIKKLIGSIHYYLVIWINYYRGVGLIIFLLLFELGMMWKCMHEGKDKSCISQGLNPRDVQQFVTCPARASGRGVIYCVAI